MNLRLILSVTLSVSLLSCSVSAETKYDPTVLPKGHDYFQLRDGLANCRRKFAHDRVGRVVFLGGSITAGGAWRQHVCDELRRRFPNTEFEFINAGIPSLGSVPHAFRFERDVLRAGSGKPVDLLFVEAAVNDTTNIPDHPEQMLRGMEGVVRHMRTVSPQTDVVQLHFVMPEHMTDYGRGKTPISIAQHERVAAAYGNVSMNLSREVTDRIDAGEFTWADDFKDLHPSPFGHRVYANSIARMFDEAFAGPLPAAVKPHTLPEAVDHLSYARGRLGDIASVR
ncbi:MAG: SGNH/GDSL hydrolase family protein, partial [Planctomycetales bacterium]|nr:SGNH/GDSL hydrolase family protein [Planctomycetales bacterium]